MNNNNIDVLLSYISPADLTYTEWVQVGMALKHAGYQASDWDAWSRADSRYHAGECEKKWRSFNGSTAPVTAGTLYQMAVEHGYQPERHTEHCALNWDDEINYECGMVNSDEGIRLREPSTWNPVNEITTYLETLFDADDNVGYVTETWEKTENGNTKYLPTKGCYDRTAGELLKLIANCNGDIGAVFGDYNPAAGAWIRFNPLDGRGVKNENVTEYRYALVESDSMAIEQQQSIIRELELPVAVLVYSGGKSVHAIVKIDAANYDEYRKRVDYLYGICKSNGLDIDQQNRNPSRLSRMPGVERNGNKQYIIDRNIGRGSWDEWREYIDSINDNLPNTENLADVWDDMPPLAPCLIDGMLRQGHKMLVAGPSKAGKSFALIELCCAIAEGREWLGFSCTQGRIMYVNLELDRPSCLRRFRDVYTALGWQPKRIADIDIWNLRGHSVPMDKLAPMLIRRAQKSRAAAIVIDPIYKVITGDENSADQMAHFCNQFDKLCTELGCAVIYCHHHSKGAQGGKRSMDRASGSGVFARDPDALIDLIELEPTDFVFKQQENAAVCGICAEWLTRFHHNDCTQDDLCSASVMMKHCDDRLSPESCRLMYAEIDAAKKRARTRTAWRLDGTLREFAKFEPINVWFDYPTHIIDDCGALQDVPFAGENDYRKNFAKRKTPDERANERADSIEMAFAAVAENGRATAEQLAEYMGVSTKTVKRRIREHGNFTFDKNDCTYMLTDKIG